jgi:tetratricopeptide (TPR) repeat protein
LFDGQVDLTACGDPWDERCLFSTLVLLSSPVQQPRWRGSQRISAARRRPQLDHLVDPPKRAGVPWPPFCRHVETSVSDTVTDQPLDNPRDPKLPASEAAASNPGGTVGNDLTSGPDAGSSPDVATPGDTPIGDDGLPEWEPLTPELVEDEAIRGDFVIRWVVVGLALLLGISQISETRTLVHVKNGQYLIGHGLLPGGKDIFSYTASDRRWVNLPWLFDIAVAGVDAIGGGIGLSIVQGLLAGLAFGLLAHTVRPGIRTWWGSLCAVLALLACYPQFTVQPELVTLLGMTSVLWMLVRSEEPGPAGRLWQLVPLIWVWAQLDQRAWFGWFLLLLWAAGDWLSRGTSSAIGKSPLARVALASLAIVVIHPFLWESWLAPVRLFLTDYRAMQVAFPQPSIVDQVFYPVWKEFLWVKINHRTVAALILVAGAVVTMLLNRSRTRWSHVLVFLGFNGLSVLATHELAAASLVNCALCTLNAQAWYRERFGQVYSIDWRELLFSRGGRAVTVMSFFALAWLILSGRLDGPGGKRTGVGYDPHLASAMSDYRDLSTAEIDDRPFNFSMRQGDLMIWGGQKTFVDSRAGLFYGDGRASSNLLAVHSKTRNALLQRRDTIEGSGEPDVWKATFDQYHIRQAWPRLNGPIPPPDYRTFFDLLGSGEFLLNDLNASTGVFLRKDPSDATTAEYLKGHPFDFVQLAFRKKRDAVENMTRDWAQAATTYDNLFSLRRPIVPGGVQAAQHFLQLAATGGGFPYSQRCACVLLAIRHANEGLRNEPNSADGYLTLGMAYSLLGQLESVVLNQNSGARSTPNSVRYYQSVAALQQAHTLEPQDPGVIRQLLQQYEVMGRADIQLELFRKLKRLQKYSKKMTDEQRRERERIIDAIGRLEEPVNRMDEMVAKHLGENNDRFQVALGAYQVGGLLIAIKILEVDAIYLEKNPEAKVALGMWLTEVGRGKDAELIFDSLEVLARDGSYGGWRDSAAMCSLMVANYQRTIDLWNTQANTVAAVSLPQTLLTFPFVTLTPVWLGPDSYPSANIAATSQLINDVRGEAATMRYQIALAQMESGANEDAIGSIHTALQLNPNTPLRPLLRLYLECLSGEQIELKPSDVDLEQFDDLSEPEAKIEARIEPKPEQKPDPKPN